MRFDIIFFTRDFGPQMDLELQAQNGPEFGPKNVFRPLEGIFAGLKSDFQAQISGPKNQANASREKSTE
jgi:hypothetical protein